MTGFGSVAGIDFTLPQAPPLRLPPLSLLDLAPVLLSVDDAAAAAQAAVERAASAQVAVEDAVARLSAASPAEQAAAAMAIEEARDRLVELEALSGAQAKEAADAQRWEHGFEYLPELSNDEALEIWVPDSGDSKRDDSTRGDSAWYDPFEAVAHDDRSAFGWPGASYEDRAQRAMRALLAHESWQVEREFWTGEKIPTNFHLAAGPNDALVSPHRTMDAAWAAPTAAPGTTLGVAVGMKKALAALNQAIASSDAGVGMLHATPYLVQLWSSVSPFLRDSSGRVMTVNFNLIVPGYGYPGTGAARSVDDAVTTDTDETLTSATAAFTASDVGAAVTGDGIPDGTTIASVTNATTVELSAPATASAVGVTIVIAGGDATGSRYQWAFATDMVFRLAGAARTLPYGLGQEAPGLTVNNDIEVRAERSHALITNQLLRAAVLVDTETA